MESYSKTEAQRRADQIRYFQTELGILEQENIIHLDETRHLAISGYHSKLLEHLADSYDVDTTSRGKQLSLGMKIASFLGALGLAASAFFLFYQFWGKFSTPFQIFILIAAPMISLIATILTAKREQTGYFSKLIGLVCFACFILNIFMFGQIFNITPSDKAFIVWAVFGFLLAYACDVRLLLSAGIICITCFLSARMGTWAGCYWIHFGERPENFFPAAFLLFIIPAIFSHKKYAGFGTIYRVFAMLIFFIPILILSNWGYSSYMQFDMDSIEAFYQMAGFIFSGTAIWLGIKTNKPEVVNTGNVFFVIFLYTKFFDWWWDWMPKYLFFLVLGLTAILALLIFKRLRNVTFPSDKEAEL